MKRIALLVLLLFGFCGCQNTEVGETGTLVVSLDWPDSSRGIPSYVRSARVAVEIFDEEGEEDLEGWLQRAAGWAHTQSVVFDDLRRFPSGNPDLQYVRMVEVFFYSEYNFQGEILGYARAFVSFGESDRVQIRIAQLAYPLMVRLTAQGPTTVKVGQTIQFSGNGLDIQDRVLALPEGALVWEILSGADHATISQNGELTGVTPGTVRVRLRDVDGEVTPIDFDVTVEP